MHPPSIGATIGLDMDTLPNELRIELEANAKATVDSYYENRKEAFKEGKRRELEEGLEDLDLQHQQALEGIKRGLRWENGDGGGYQTPPPQDVSSFPEESPVARNGSSGLPTKREMLIGVLADLRGRTFFRRDADAKVIERWPEAGPKTPAERKTFAAANAGFLNYLAKEGKLRVWKGEGRFDPAEYEVVEDDEDTLLRPEP